MMSLRSWARRLMHLGAAILVAAYIWRISGGAESVEMELLPDAAAVQGSAMADAYYGKMPFSMGRKPFGREIWLKSFRIEEYPDGSPSAYLSEIWVDRERTEIGVNRPWRKGCDFILQSSWFEVPDMRGGTFKGSVLTAMRDRTWPLALAGFAFLLLGAWLYAVLPLRRRCPPQGSAPVLSMATVFAMGLAATVMAVIYTWRTGHVPLADVKGFLLVSAAALPFVALSSRRMEGKGFGVADFMLEAVLLAGAVAMKGRTGGLPPALQSPFFVPHVGAYIFGYVILARSALNGLAALVPLGFAFITTGMALGSMWGEICWGAWWSFDPKETWSLVTWLVFAALFHVPREGRMARAILWAGFALIVLTLLWVNFSRLFAGLHSYAG